MTLDHGEPVRFQPGCRHRFAHPGDPLALDVEMRALQLFRRDQFRRLIADPAFTEAHGQQADLVVAQTQDVLGHLPHRRPVVDTHPRRPRDVLGLVDDDDRKVALQHGLQVGIVVRGGIDHEPVHPRRQHRVGAVGDVAAGTRRDQEQPLAGLFARFSQARNEIESGRVTERVRQRLGDQQSGRAGPAGPQRAGDRVRARIAQPLGGGQHPLSQIGRQLVGPVVGIGDGGARDLELGGQ